MGDVMRRPGCVRMCGSRSKGCGDVNLPEHGMEIGKVWYDNIR